MSGSVSLVNGHIDPIEKEMTPQEALAWVEDYEKAIKEERAFLNNGDEFHIEALKVCKVVKQALEKQLSKKPKKRKDTTYNFCPCCDSGNLMNDYCTDCGQKIDWSDTE